MPPPPNKDSSHCIILVSRLSESSAQCQVSKAMRAEPWGSSRWHCDTHPGSPRILAKGFFENHLVVGKRSCRIFQAFPWKPDLSLTPNVWVRTSRNLIQALKTGKLHVWKSFGNGFFSWWFGIIPKKQPFQSGSFKFQTRLTANQGALAWESLALQALD